MPKRKVLKTSKETIEAFKQAQKQPYVITPEQSEAHAQRLADGMVKRIDSGAYVVERGRGKKLVFREGPGLAGPDYKEHPLTRQMQETERELLTVAAKIRREARLVMMSKTRARKSLRSKIERLLLQHGLHNRYACSKIASQLQVDGSYVRKIRNEMRLTESE